MNTVRVGRHGRELGVKVLEIVKPKIGQCVIVHSLADLKLTVTPVGVIDIETFGADRLPGDVATCSQHGICGIALCNAFGDAVYLVIKRPGYENSIPEADVIKYLNENWMTKPGMLMVVHHGKFDLGFLIHRGLDIRTVKLIDTWLLSSIGNQGIFKSNKLKESIRDRHGIQTASEEEKDKFFVDNKTKDYGELPLNLIAPYACDDVRYALILALNYKTSDADKENHDLYMRNCLHLIRAENRGICVDLGRMRGAIAGTEKALKEGYDQLLAQLNGIEINIDDPQQMFKHLHSSGLFNEPRSWFGENMYVFDPDLMETLFKTHPIVELYYWYYRRSQFMKYFSPRAGLIGYRMFKDAEDNVGIHLGQHLSVSKKGGMPLLKFPDFDHSILLNQEIRDLFCARAGHRLVTVNILNTDLQLLLFYLGITKLENMPGLILDELVNATKLKPEVVQCCLRTITEGWGAKPLAMNLRRKDVKGMANNPHYGWKDQIAAALPGYANLQKRLTETLNSTSTVSDRLGRQLIIEKKQHWRAFAVLLQSSAGSIYSATLDILCRIAERNGAYLVAAHHNEFVFEVPNDNDSFVPAIRPGIQQHATWTPIPHINVINGKWESGTETLGRDW